jgi:hypothetical protein
MSFNDMQFLKQHNVLGRVKHMLNINELDYSKDVTIEEMQLDGGNTPLFNLIVLRGALVNPKAIPPGTPITLLGQPLFTTPFNIPAFNFGGIFGAAA